MAPSSVGLSVVVPVYNEAESVDRLHRAVTAAVRERTEEDGYELILVDDGSTDGTAERLDAIASGDERVRVLHFERNCGQTSAIFAGIRQARGRFVALIDADMQTDPEDIFTLMPYMER